MIDLTAPADLLAEDGVATLSRRLAEALLRAEGAPLAEPYLANTGVFVHRLPAHDVHTAGTERSRTVRIEVLTPPGALDRSGQRQLVEDATRIVADHVGDPSQAARTWVLLREAAEGGWGVSGIALGAEEFSALRAAREATGA
jgi:phenylpyruvate tautomerase PptA (4-oxalocrotonate tautomerase family)